MAMVTLLLIQINIESRHDINDDDSFINLWALITSPATMVIPTFAMRQ